MPWLGPRLSRAGNCAAACGMATLGGVWCPLEKPEVNQLLNVGLRQVHMSAGCQ